MTCGKNRYAYIWYTYIYICIMYIWWYLYRIYIGKFYRFFFESGDETDTFRKKGDETDTLRDETDTFAGVEEERKMSRKESTFIENKTYVYKTKHI